MEISPQILAIIEKDAMIKNVKVLIEKLQQTFGTAEKIKLINEQDKHGYCLVHYFSAVDYHEIINILSINGADMNVKTRDCKKTPLIIATEYGNEMSVKAILESSNR